MGCFFSFYAFNNATVYAFNNGVRWVRALKCLFLQCFGGGNPGPVILVGAQNIGRDLGAPCRKWGCSKHIFALYIWHVLLGWIGCETGFFFAMCKNAQNCGENGFFTLSVSNLQHEGQNRGFGKKAKIYFWRRAHHHFCVFWCRASFWQKTVFPKSTKFRWNHWKRSAKLARPQNAILAPEGPKWAILVRVTNGPDISVAVFAALADTSSRRQGQLFDISCFFPSWQQVTFYHFNDWTFPVQ